MSKLQKLSQDEFVNNAQKIARTLVNSEEFVRVTFETFSDVAFTQKTFSRQLQYSSLGNCDPLIQKKLTDYEQKNKELESQVLKLEQTINTIKNIKVEQ